MRQLNHTFGNNLFSVFRLMSQRIVANTQRWQSLFQDYTGEFAKTCYCLLEFYRGRCLTGAATYRNSYFPSGYYSANSKAFYLIGNYYHPLSGAQYVPGSTQMDLTERRSSNRIIFRRHLNFNKVKQSRPDEQENNKQTRTILVTATKWLKV